MHEMCHFCLAELEKLAAVAPDSQAGKDFATVKAWAEWHDGDSEAFKGTATTGEFAEREKAIKDAEKAEQRKGAVARNLRRATVFL